MLKVLTEIFKDEVKINACAYKSRKHSIEKKFVTLREDMKNHLICFLHLTIKIITQQKQLSQKRD